MPDQKLFESAKKNPRTRNRPGVLSCAAMGGAQ